MEQLMREDPWKFRVRTIESNAPLTQERAGMDGAAAVAESGNGFDADGRAGERWETAEAPFAG
jgi:hypothetical protein